jgi:hypothetical protein
VADEPVTPNSDETNSEGTTPNPAPETSDTSTTPNPNPKPEAEAEGGDDEVIDLGTGKKPEAEVEAEGGDEEDTRTDEERAADEARAELHGAPPEDEPYKVEGLPEGMAIDAAAVEAITPLARQLDLSQKGFSALAQTYATEVLPGVTKQIVDGINNDVLETRKGWETDAREMIAGKGEKLQNLAGEPISFDGRALPEVQKIAAKALDRLAPAGFREWLDETGLGVHPNMIAFAYNAGKTIAEDREVETSETGRAKPKSSGAPMSDPAKYYDRT